MCVWARIGNCTRRIQSFIYVTLVDLCCQHRLIVDHTRRVQFFIHQYLSLVDLCCQHRLSHMCRALSFLPRVYVCGYICVVVHIVNYTRRVQSFIHVTLVDLCCQHRLKVDYTRRVQSFIHLYLSLVDLCYQHRLRVYYTRRVQSFIHLSLSLVDLCCQHRLIVEYTRRVQSFIRIMLVDLCSQHRWSHLCRALSFFPCVNVCECVWLCT